MRNSPTRMTRPVNDQDDSPEEMGSGDDPLLPPAAPVAPACAAAIGSIFVVPHHPFAISDNITSHVSQGAETRILDAMPFAANGR